MHSIEIELKQAIASSIEKAFGIQRDLDQIVIETPKQKGHGDYFKSGNQCKRSTGTGL